MYSIPGLGILPGKRMEWTLSGGRTVHRALLGTVHIPGVILIPGWRNWGSERLSHLPKRPSAEVKCPLHWFMSPFALKSVPLITTTHMVIWATCSRYSAQSRCSVLRVAGFTDSKQRAKRRAHCCCKPRYIPLPGPITHYMENEIDDSASFLNFGMASNIYEIVRSLSGWKPSQKPTISLPFLLVITESFRCLPKITDLKTSTTNSLRVPRQQFLKLKKCIGLRASKKKMEVHIRVWVCVSASVGGRGKTGVEGENHRFSYLDTLYIKVLKVYKRVK